MGVGGIRLRCDGEAFRHVALFDDLHHVSGLANDGAGIATDEGVAAQMFTAFDGFEQEGFALAPNLLIRRERRFVISQNAAGDGNQVALFRQLQEFVARW